MNRRWYQLRHLAAATGISARTLRSLTASGTIPAWQPDDRAWYLYGPEALSWYEARGVRIDRAALTDTSISSQSSDFDDDETRAC